MKVPGADIAKSLVDPSHQMFGHNAHTNNVRDRSTCVRKDVFWRTMYFSSVTSSRRMPPPSTDNSTTANAKTMPPTTTAQKRWGHADTIVANDDAATVALHPTVKSMLMAAQLAEDEEQKKHQLEEKLNSHHGDHDTSHESGAEVERERRRQARQRHHRHHQQQHHHHHVCGASCGDDELDDWLAQAERERRSWNLWDAPDEYPMQVAERHTLATGRDAMEEKKMRAGTGTAARVLRLAFTPCLCLYSRGRTIGWRR